MVFDLVFGVILCYILVGYWIRGCWYLLLVFVLIMFDLPCILMVVVEMLGLATRCWQCNLDKVLLYGLSRGYELRKVFVLIILDGVPSFLVSG